MGFARDSGSAASRVRQEVQREVGCVAEVRRVDVRLIARRDRRDRTEDIFPEDSGDAPPNPLIREPFLHGFDGHVVTVWRRTCPASAPVGRPYSTAIAPFTNTQSIPSGYSWG